MRSLELQKAAIDESVLALSKAAGFAMSQRTSATSFRASGGAGIGSRRVEAVLFIESLRTGRPPVQRREMEAGIAPVFSGASTIRWTTLEKVSS